MILAGKRRPSIVTLCVVACTFVLVAKGKAATPATNATPIVTSSS
jgi:hypothetical protein